ncbi:hypothetical protein O181_002686 [Austropuccinia psidii MF-1]|uniref:RNase H type-1 domain-containing protein n=1 Tax=Austropuccinia psidii MF-1 TaxID=1389203 RepID=A0A9Q3GDG7_9BASI|nr:hypothetical protein [Austropuccinia psidii MF-1]
MKTIMEEAIDKVKQLVEDRKLQDAKIFMDGSDIPDKGKSAAAIIMLEGPTVTRHITKTTLSANFELELVGLKLVIELIKRKLYSKKERQELKGKVHIFCDNQGALRKVANPTIPSTGQHLYLQISNELLSLSQLMTINLTWLPGNKGIEGNKKADTEAKKSCIQPINPRTSITYQQSQNQTTYYGREQTRKVHS